MLNTCDVAYNTGVILPILAVFQGWILWILCLLPGFDALDTACTSSNMVFDTPGTRGVRRPNAGVFNTLDTEYLQVFYYETFIPQILGLGPGDSSEYSMYSMYWLGHMPVLWSSVLVMSAKPKTVATKPRPLPPPSW